MYVVISKYCHCTFDRHGYYASMISFKTAFSYKAIKIVIQFFDTNTDKITKIEKKRIIKFQKICCETSFSTAAKKL